MAMRDACAKALALGRPAVTPRHVCRGPSLINEDEPLRIEIELLLEPGLPPLQDVRAILLARVCGLFFLLIPRRLKKRHSVP